MLTDQQKAFLRGLEKLTRETGSEPGRDLLYQPGKAPSSAVA